jgi:hypothetical protein
MRFFSLFYDVLVLNMFFPPQYVQLRAQAPDTAFVSGG